jgi:hypothetical protein
MEREYRSGRYSNKEFERMFGVPESFLRGDCDSTLRPFDQEAVKQEK